MLKLLVIKTGFEPFDALHVYGLAVLIAEAVGVIVTLQDHGPAYRLCVPDLREPPHVGISLMDILALPANDDLADSRNVELANLDGLLAVLFTSPGVRAVSLSDVRGKQQYDPLMARHGLDKARSLAARLVKANNRVSPQLSLELILQTYSADAPKVPCVHPKAPNDIGVNMTIDPACAYSTRRPVSDGLISDKANVTVSGTPLASVLAHIGAARFLRAQRVAGRQVNLYVPLFEQLSVKPGFWLPLLPNVDRSAGQAALVQLLSITLLFGADFVALSYQTLQLQGAKQSFSVLRGHLSTPALLKFDKSGFAPVVVRWLDILTTPAKDCRLDQDLLCDALTLSSPPSWRRHLHNIAQLVNARNDNDFFAYRLSEVSIMIESENSTECALSSVMQKDQGTLRFGRSLRSLGEHRRADLRDSLDEIDAVRNRDQLIRALARSIQRCVIAKATSKFVIVPNDTDFTHLLDDVDRWGVRDIAGLLIILSSLRYPPQPAGSDQAAATDFAESDYSI